MTETFDDYLIDAKLNIETTGRNDSFSDTFRFPYEATDYSVLNRIVEEGYITKDDCLVDYGCGKGRVPIYLNYRIDCKAIGVEMVEEFLVVARSNKEKYEKGDEITLVCAKAEEWEVPKEATCLFFFNPFSVKILRGVMNRILDSYYDSPREMKLFFYYPSDEYVAFLSGVEEVDFVDEIDCVDLFPGNDTRNRVMIWEIYQ